MISISPSRCGPSLLKIPAILAGGALLLLAGCGGGSNSGGGGGGGGSNPTTYTITVNSANPSSGVSISYGNSVTNLLATGSTSFTLTENSGTTMIFGAPATASNGNTFSSWTGCTSTSGTNNADCTVTVSSNVTIAANYTTAAPTTYSLTVNSTNPTSGVAITASPTDVNGHSSGSSSFSLTYDSGASVTLTAPATAGTNTFTSWTGCASTSGFTCTITMTANTTVTANYATPVNTYSLTVDTTAPTSGVTITASPADANSHTSGNSPFSLSYASGTSVTLTAPSTASNGNTFSSWTGCTSTSGMACTVTVSANTTVTANYAAAAPAAYTLTVDSTSPASGVQITSNTSDNNGHSSGTSPFTLTYNSGTSVTLTAPVTSGSNNFSSWTGCASTSGQTCTVTLSSNTTVTANYTAGPAVTISPGNGSSVAIGSSQQFTATVTGEGTNTAVTWSVALSSGTGSPGTISSSGLYQTPYPAPTSVTVTATSVAAPSVSASVTITLTSPATAAGPALSVDAGTITRAISPLIYGMNAYLLDSTTAQNANITVARWGGDDTSRYNYQTNVVNSANDYYFENFTGSSGMLGGGSFDGFLTAASTAGIKALGTANVIGYVSNNTPLACSFPKVGSGGQPSYPGQQSYNGNCGNGVYPQGTNGCTNANGCSIFGDANTPQYTSIAEPPPSAPGAGNATTTWADNTWVGGWVNSLVSNSSYGPGNPASGKSTGVSIWDLDNEPEYWSAVHRDVHPNPMTYDEITNGGIGTALAIKTVDPTAQVSGPIISGWYQYFYSQQDVNNGYSKSPCYQPWDNPTDREAHSGIPLIEYYLQQMAAASTTYGMRLLDYVDIHAYFAGTYNGSSVAFTTAGDTGEQQARMNSTRVFWDPTYTDPNLPQPNYLTDTGYTTSCTQPDLPPEIIPRMQSWTATDFPGTKTSIDEYNFGGMESINGAITQADILGIFGKYGLDMATLWPTTNYTAQVPGTMAFEIYRNYDGKDSTFGDSEISSTTADQSKLAVYAGVRSSDNAVTIVVINKTYGTLTSTLSVNNLTGSPTSAQVYQYSNANLTAIVPQAAATITPPTPPSTTSTLSGSFPAQSITLFVIPQ